MNTTIKYTPSINIVRDINTEFNYIPTHNSIDVFNQLINNHKGSNKCQIIIGAYGTGKSSLLLAMMQTLTGVCKHFNLSKTSASKNNFEFIPIVGSYTSFISTIADIFLRNKKDYATKDIITAIKKKYNQLQDQNKTLVFLVDEFGKFLEYAAKNNPESELYFLQELAEWINDQQHNAMFAGVLHQDFNAYSNALNKIQKQEWDKVKGRFKEIVFNEPVEQLLYLASERISQKLGHTNFDKNFNKLFQLIKESKAFPLKDYLEVDIAKKLYPFDILSVAILTLSLQRYGQNERSLFSFLESNNSNFTKIEKGEYFSMDKVYDYLLNNFYSIVTSSNKSTDFLQWSGIRKALEKADGVLDKDINADAQKIIKTIGLLNLFASNGARLDDAFYKDYLRIAENIKDPAAVINKLAEHKIIRFIKHNLRYVIFEGTDLNIDLAIDEAGKLVEKVHNVVALLNQHFAFPFIPAKSIFYKTGTPRFFQFRLSENPIYEIPEDEIDGFINLIFSSEHSIEKKVQAASKECEEAILYGVYKNTAAIQRELFEIQKVRQVIADNREDRVALKYLNDILKNHINLLNHAVLDSLYSDQQNIIWFYNGKRLNIKSRHSFNKELSEICAKVYYATPVFKNELINKTKVSGQISLAKNKLTALLLNNIGQKNIGFDDNKFPPEKTIYLSLIRETGLHKEIDNVWQWHQPTDKSFTDLWKHCEQFLNSTKTKERSVQELIDGLLIRPFKLKKGFIDFWIPIFLMAKADDYALFDNDIYIPELTQDILELMAKKPAMFKVKAFDLSGIRLELFNRYRIFLSQPENSKPNNSIFIQTIKPFLNFYKSLPEYAMHTKQLSKQAIALREVIKTTKDPEKTFFDDFPAALGYSLQELQQNPALAENYIKQLQERIRELRTCYEELLTRFENFLAMEVLGVQAKFEVYKEHLLQRYASLKVHLLTPQQKVFYNRIVSPLNERASWLNSICQTCINKPLKVITDEDERVLYDKLKEYITALDNFTDISKVKVNEQLEDVVKLELTSLVKGIQQNILHLPKTKNQEINHKQREIRTILGKDKKINLAVLALLLQEYLSDEQ